MSELQHLSLSETIAKVDALIDSGNGDAGRLYHILEFLKNNRPLYHSDKIYLEKKLNSSFSVENEPQEENTLLPKIKELIDSGNGDLGRLQSIYDAVSNNKPLYRSDSIYLESKLNPLSENIAKTFDEPPPKIVLPKSQKVIQEETLPKKIQGSMPKGWSSENKSEELEEITENILDEKKKIETQTKINDEINLQRSNLSQLISHRKEYEQKVTKEKSSLESQIQ
jgi:hypothetical protein